MNIIIVSKAYDYVQNVSYNICMKNKFSLHHVYDATEMEKKGGLKRKVKRKWWAKKINKVYDLLIHTIGKAYWL